MVVNGAKHPLSSTELLYLPGKLGRRGSIEREYKTIKMKVAMNLYSNNDPTSSGSRQPENMLQLPENFGQAAEIERVRSAPFSPVHSNFQWRDVVWVNKHYRKLVQIFPLWIPAKTKGTRT